MRGKPLGDDAAHAEIARIDQHHPALPAHQRDRAPAKPAMAHGLAGKALHQDVDRKPTDRDGGLLRGGVHGGSHSGVIRSPASHHASPAKTSAGRQRRYPRLPREEPGFFFTVPARFMNSTNFITLIGVVV